MKLVKISTKKVDPSNPPDGTWATYIEGAEVQIRKLNRQIVKALRDPFVTPVEEYDATLKIFVKKEKVDNEGFENAFNRYVVQNFKGFGDDDGYVLSDNDISRKALLDNKEIGEFIINYANAVEFIEEKKKGEEIKNS
jgi:hypothetical protein